MPTINKTPGGSITIRTRIKNEMQRTTREFWVGASIIDSNWTVYQDLSPNKVSLGPGQEGIVSISDEIQPYLRGSYKITIAVWDRDPRLSNPKELARNTSWNLEVQPTETYGYYKFYSNPVTAVVYVNNQKIGIANTGTAYKLITGSYTAEFRATGYATAVVNIKVEEGKTKTYTANLNPI